MPEIKAAAAMHSQRHAADGPDPVTPADIGAPDVEQVSGTVDTGGGGFSFGPGQAVSNGAAVESALTVADLAYTTAMAAAPKEHAANHATGGSDPITPASIGAAPTSHTHTPEEAGAFAKFGSTYGNHVDDLRQPGAYRASGSSMNASNGYPWTPDAVGYVIVHGYSTAYVTQEVISENGTVWRRNSVAGSTTAWRSWVPVAVDTGWRSIPLENGWTGNLYLRWRNGYVTITVNGLNGTAATSSNLCTNIGNNNAFYPGAGRAVSAIGNTRSVASAPSGSDLGSIGMTGGTYNSILRASGPSSAWTGGHASITFPSMNDVLPANLPGTPA